MSGNSTVFVVDDDPAICELIRTLGQSVKLDVKTYGSAQEFLDGYSGCDGPSSELLTYGVILGVDCQFGVHIFQK